MHTKLTGELVDPNPIRKFGSWFQEALKADLREPNAMILATADENNEPTQRTLLLKFFDEKGFVFFTNYHSTKAQHIKANNRVSLLFPWYGLERQVVIYGKAEKISTLESAKYFLSRPFGSQLGAWVSHQSQVVSSRSLLEAKMAEMKHKFSQGKVPIPDFWGGYRIRPTRMEFLQLQQDHLRDRIRYQLNGKHWQVIPEKTGRVI